MSTIRCIVSIFSIAMLVLGADGVSGQTTSTGSGQGYPNKVIRIVTAAAGGNQDIAARVIAQGIAGPLGQPVIVENRASSILIAPLVSQSPPDGYTLLIAGEAFLTAALLQGNQPDPGALSPISILVSEPNILVVHPSLPVKSVKELIALAKARPGELNYAAATLGSVQHLSGLLFNARAGVNTVGVSYKGSGPAINGVTGGEVQLGFMSLSLVAPFIKAGRLRALAVTSLQPSTLVPELPTVAASGLPGFEMTSALSMYAPPKTPVAIINQLNREVVRTLRSAEVREKYSNLGSDVIGSSPEELAARIKALITVMGKLIKDAGLKVD